MHIITIVCVLKRGIGSLYFACHKTGGWLRKSRRVLKRINKND